MRREIIVTVHGIRTYGEWQERLEGYLHQDGKDFEFVHYKYGYFSLLAFIFPFTRWLVTRKFRDEIQNIHSSDESAVVHFVAHSFGTHLVGWALRQIADADLPQIGTVILAGSVLKSGHPWGDLLAAKKIHQVINDCGSNDWILVINQLLVFGTGMAGRIGFNGMMSSRFVNRIFSGGHSHYFEGLPDKHDQHMKKYWVPLLKTDQPASPVDERPALNALTGIREFVLRNSTPIKIAIYGFIVWLPAIYVFGLYQDAEQQRTVAEIRQQEADEQRRIAEVRRRSAIDTVVWVFNELAHFPFDRSSFTSPEIITIMGGIPERLHRSGFTGYITLESHVGRYCWVRSQSDSTDIELAPPNIPASECTGRGGTREYDLALGSRKGRSVADILRTALTPEYDIGVAAVTSYGQERPLIPYPDTSVSAEAWNEIARRNSRVSIQLVEERPEDE